MNNETIPMAIGKRINNGNNFLGNAVIKFDFKRHHLEYWKKIDRSKIDTEIMCESPYIKRVCGETKYFKKVLRVKS